MMNSLTVPWLISALSSPLAPAASAANELPAALTSKDIRATMAPVLAAAGDCYDAYGIMGQITEVGVLQSHATLITDPDHATPVQVSRNGLRAIVFGTGVRDGLSVRYLTSSADIKEGDTLISSGLGGSFPFGYPVAVVTHIVNDPNESFLDISARPIAHLGHNKEVLLIWPTRGALVNPTQKPSAAKPGK